VAADGCDDGLAQLHPAGAHRPVALGLDAVGFAACERLEVGAGAERAARAPQHAGEGAVVGLERAEGIGERLGGGAIDRVADLGAVEDDRRHRTRALDPDGHRLSRPRARRPLAARCVDDSRFP
jgi:hypothetical protein